MHTPAASTCMHTCTHSHTQILYEYKCGTCEHETRCVSPRLLSVRISTYLPVELITGAPAQLVRADERSGVSQLIGP